MIGKGVIIGCGRIGAPMLAWMHASKPEGLEMVGVDTNSELIGHLREGDTGWYEEGMDDYFRDNPVPLIDVNETPLNDVFWENVKFAVVCLGSPVIDGKPDVNPIRRVIEDIPNNVLIVLRSTVPPGFTEQLSNESGKTIIFAPERILTGNALTELDTLPQNIGVVGQLPLDQVENYKLFTSFFHTVSVYKAKEVELSKIGNNVIRYIEFTAGTQFAMACEKHGADWRKVREAMTQGYDRGRMCYPAFSSSYCLNKDFQMLGESMPILSVVSAEFNQKALLIDLMVRALIENKANPTNVGILGWTYRPESDDDRDTITEYWLTLLRNDAFKCEQIYLYDPIKMPELDDVINVNSTDALIKSSDLIIVATAHSEFEKVNKALLSGKTVIDLTGIINPTTSFVEAYE